MAVSTEQSNEHQLDSDFPSLKNHLLVAMPGLSDPFFKETVTYIIQHDEEGAMGVMINQTMPVSQYELLKQLGFDAPKILETADVLSGGPVQMQRGFVLHKGHGEWDSSMAINDEVALTSSMDILQAISHDEGPEHYQLLLGYAGWDAGQLDQEMLDNSWLTVPVNETLIFDTPLEQRWQQASQSIGIDINQLTLLAGHS